MHKARLWIGALGVMAVFWGADATGAETSSSSSQGAVGDVWRGVNLTAGELRQMGMIENPTTHQDVLRNLRVAFEKDLLLREEFYTTDTISRFFGGDVEENTGMISETHPADISTTLRGLSGESSGRIDFNNTKKNGKNSSYVNFSRITTISLIKAKEILKYNFEEDVNLIMTDPDPDWKRIRYSDTSRSKKVVSILYRQSREPVDQISFSLTEE